MLVSLLVPAGIAGFLYLIRKYRESKWGWVKNTYSLKGKTFIITGANTGLGYHTARALVKRGALVVLCCRSLERVNAAIEKIKRETSEGSMAPLELDLGSFESIRKCAAQIKSNYAEFNCLILNAGVYAKSEQNTQENHEVHFGVNHLGHFMLFKLLEDYIQRNKSRVVVVSSLLHQGGTIDFEKLGQYQEYKASHLNRLYSNSKLMNFYFARELYKKGFDVHVLCPGWCYTELSRERKFKWYQILAMSPIIFLMMRSGEQGAQNIIHAATDSENDEKLNPSNGYYIRSLQMIKSSHEFDDKVGERLWEESLKMCGIK